MPGVTLDPRSIPKITRWIAAATAIAIVLAVAGIYVRRSWLASQAMRHAPAAVPPSVEQRFHGFTFSKVEGQQTVFTIRAARATKYTGKKSSMLEDVDIVVYGEHGERHDEIHTRSCDYQTSSGVMLCRGKVELDLASVRSRAKAESNEAAQIHVETSGVRFNRETGQATTDAPVKFQFPQGRGSAIGVSYSSKKATLTLGRDVDLTLSPNRPGALPAKVTSKGGLSYDRSTGKLLLKGPVTINKGSQSLASSKLTVMLNPRLRPLVAKANGGVTADVNQAGQPAHARADEAVIRFDRQGRADRVNASGDVEATQGGGNRLESQRASVTLDPVSQQPREVFANGDVRLQSVQPGRTERLRSAALYLKMRTVDPSTGKAAGSRGSKSIGRLRLEEATTPGRTQVEWQSAGTRVRLDAGRLAATFAGENKIQDLSGTGGVKLDRREAGQAPVHTTARRLRVLFSDGQWAHAEESGGVDASQGDRKAEAQRASLSRTRQEVKLEGKARVHDPTGQTLADTIYWNQGTGALRASGNVRTTYYASARHGTAVAPSAGPVNVVAKTLLANSAAGKAVYSGGARLWQGPVVIQAAQITLLRKSGTVTATGGVRGAFPQAKQQSPGHKDNSSKAEGKQPEVLWRVRSQRMTYVNRERSGKVVGGAATLDGGVEAESTDGRIQAKRLVLQLRRGHRGGAQVTRAVGDGGVEVRQGTRWGRGERAIYNAAQGKFVLSGARPSFHDTSGDLVTGSQLTFYVANDTILVESTKGSRTLTRHPIHKKK